VLQLYSLLNINPRFVEGSIFTSIFSAARAGILNAGYTLESLGGTLKTYLSHDIPRIN
jgi:hypothetical protein